MNKNTKHCAIYAHKGAIKEAADNTRQSFNKALTYNIDGIETDIQISKDKVLILYHNRLMAQLGYPNNHICDFTFEQLKKINFSGYFPSALAEEPITLKEFLDSYSKRCKLLLEIKHRDWEDSLSAQTKIQQCLDFIGNTQNNDIIICSFSMECLQYAQQINPQIPVIYTFRNTHRIDEITDAVNRYQFLSGVCLPIHTLNTSLMHFLQYKNKQVLTYTCNTVDEIQKALDFKVDIIITDDPATALQLRDS